MRRHLALLLMSVAVVAAGCGDDEADQARDRAGTITEQVQDLQDDLSDEARAVLDRAGEVGGDLATTAEGLAAEELSSAEAERRLDAAARQAETLAQRAADLPQTDAARDRLVAVTAELQQAAERAREAVGDRTDADRLRDTADRLADDVRPQLEALRDDVPERARDELDRLLERLGG
ncbi:MAG TPA: hypothetical protein VD931_20830 [Baekduia sp.]|nr:hypothetical protein [Baekduia sp.]